MLHKCLFFFILSNITFQSLKGNDYVNEVNDMLTHPYWRYGVEFIKMYLNTEPLFLLFDEKVEKIDASILFPDSTTEIVTKYNFQEKENINLNSYNNRQCGFIYDKITSDCIGVTKYVECPITPPPQYDKDDDDFYTLKF
ncbi:uncharacterized protein LOC126907719 isoform X2 [Daktulosphaira vitifoliae]|uniref:uncharacterized protein LOC126907719 isoform X2 n=1 Tax=Daktulosphaira vitifoliae TaxID=58002 RepID=UPI0021A9DECE|nr:uncharacterized protein LOC126907719 isoform X2 [Daktulosphaira vitifoliae]